MTKETLIRFGAFVLVFTLIALWEALAPRRRFQTPRRRWPVNLGLLVIDAALVRVLLPVAAVGVALAATERGFGLLNVIEGPLWLEVVVAVVLLDLLVYLQHVLFHAVPGLWRLHRVHHADPQFDVSTGVRFHPVEILLSMLIKMAAVAALGAPPIAVVIFEVVLNAGSLFTHANASLPAALDRRVRLLLVTPDMHRVHHSQVRRETDSNFGFSLSVWDRLFGTYREAPGGGQDGFVIGLAETAPTHATRLGWCLVSPFAAGAARERSRGGLGE